MALKHEVRKTFYSIGDLLRLAQQDKELYVPFFRDAICTEFNHPVYFATK
jgi:hypothetical protein